MDQRCARSSLVITGLIAVLLAQHALITGAVPEIDLTAPLPALETTAAPAELASVNLPPPPAASLAALATASAPVEIKPLRASTRKLATEPEAKPKRIVKPLSAAPVTPKPQGRNTLAPLTPMKTADAAEPDNSRDPVEAPTARRPDPQPVPRTKPVPAPAPIADAKSRAEGRSLLRLLEHGEGPAIEIAWPQASSARAGLLDHFRRCHGMRVAVLDGRGRLFHDAAAPGRAWNINMDRYSGFVRASNGDGPLHEAAEAQAIRRRHGLGSSATAVRVFPRRGDAALLGGLRRLIGPGYPNAKQIRARYRLSGGRVWVEQIRVDGAPVAGRIDLSPGAARRCAS